MTIYGPYKGKDGRLRVVLYEDGVRRTVSYPKFLVEQKLGRSLGPKELIHHKDGNPDNNDLDNLEIVSTKEHGVKHRIIRYGTCIYCKKVFELSYAQCNTRAKSQAGPFCSKQCSGLYGALLQNGYTAKLNRT